MPVVVIALLVAVGWVGGYGIGRAAAWVRDVWPDPAPQLVADKVAAPEPADVGGPVQGCSASGLTLTAMPDATHVQPGQAVMFDVSITNSGRRPCVVDGGEASRQLVITDAEGTTVWTSAHCAGEARNLLLAPGDVDQRSLRWTGRPSVEGSCTQGQSAVAPGTYTAQVRMADIPDATSDPVTITVEAPPPPPEPTPDPTPETSPSPADEQPTEDQPTEDQPEQEDQPPAQ